MEHLCVCAVARVFRPGIIAEEPRRNLPAACGRRPPCLHPVGFATHGRHCDWGEPGQSDWSRDGQHGGLGIFCDDPRRHPVRLLQLYQPLHCPLVQATQRSGDPKNNWRREGTPARPVHNRISSHRPAGACFRGRVIHCHQTALHQHGELLAAVAGNGPVSNADRLIRNIRGGRRYLRRVFPSAVFRAGECRAHI